MDPRLAEKLLRYRSSFEFACAGLFGGTQTVTVEYDDDDGPDASPKPPLGTQPVHDTDLGPPPVATAEKPPQSENSNAGSNFRTPVQNSDGAASAPVDCAAVRVEVQKAIAEIADDFAVDFNRYLDKMAAEDPSVASIARRYVMGAQHIEELRSSFAEPVAPLVAKLDGGEAEAARRVAGDVWPSLERRIREKWQAYFVMTFQEVSVERKAARDRRRLQPTIDPAALELMAKADAARRAMPELGTPSWDEPRPPPLVSPWMILVALAILAAAGGWLLLHAAR